MIVNICRDQPELKVTLVPQGADWGPPKLSETRLLISCLPPDRFAPLTPIVRAGEWAYPRPEVYPPDRQALPVLVYPAFALDDDGAVVFRFDGKLWSRPPGRYEAEVVIGDRLAAMFEIDLQPYRHVVAKVETGEVTS
jgi:hypothetical protein